MRNVLFKFLRYTGLPYLFREIIQRNRVTILLFHDISPEDADNIFGYLSRKYNIISLKNFIKALDRKDPSLIPQKALIITFDDGHKGNYRLLPIIKKYGVPITIFLCSGIIGTNRHFWFKHTPSGHSVEKLKKIPNKERLYLLKEEGFEQTKEFPSRQALSIEEIEKMKGRVDFQSHTMFHPCLPRCTHLEAKKEIFDSKYKLEHELQLNIFAISYPNGDYSDRDIRLCKDAGYKCGVTVDDGFNTIMTDPFKLKRLSLNDTNDLNELIVKSSGLWMFLKKVFSGKKKYGFTENPL